MISLATLPTSTAQQVFDHVARHLLTQKTRSTKNGGCAYRGGKGDLSCAAGCLIADKEYSEDMEGRTWISLAYKEIVPYAHTTLIAKLQEVHDYSPLDKWPQHLKQVAESFNLGYVIVDKIPMGV